MLAAAVALFVSHCSHHEARGLVEVRYPPLRWRRLQLICSSGGKDSCFNLMHCEANGHDIVAVANLCPRPQPNGAGARIDLSKALIVGINLEQRKWIVSCTRRWAIRWCL